MAARFLVFGSLNIDYVYHVDHFGKPGETLETRDLCAFTGGKGLNQAVALAQSGVEQVSFCGCVGSNDGMPLLDALDKYHIEHSHVKVSDTDVSGHTIISVDKTGQNSILLFGGANKNQDPEFMRAAIEQSSKGDYVVMQNETSLLKEMITWAYERELKVCFNASPFNPGIVDLPLQYCSYLFVNEIEGLALVGATGEKIAPRTIIQKLHMRYPKSCIILTVGVSGSYYMEPGKDEITFCQAIKALRVVDTTAAGDTFTGYFLRGISTGMTPYQSLHYGASAAAVAVSRPGAVPSIPRYTEVKP